MSPIISISNQHKRQLDAGRQIKVSLSAFKDIPVVGDDVECLVYNSARDDHRILCSVSLVVVDKNYCCLVL